MKTTWYALIPATILLSGCKSDLNQQLLERELRYQEDQIYQLQDELQAACAKLDRAAGENTSLKRQLGVGDESGAPPRPPSGRGRSEPLPSPVTVPPAIEIPDSPTRQPGSGPPGTVAPPALEGVPPLPAQGAALPAPAQGAALSAPRPSPARAATADDGVLSLPTPVAAEPDPTRGATAPAVRRLSYDEPVAGDGPATHVVINPMQTACLDADGDGTSDTVRVVFEPRDADERLVAAAGNVTIAVYDVASANPATAESAPIARLDVPAAEALAGFRRTSRNRGMQFSLRWPGTAPAGSHVRVAVRLVMPDGPPLETDATIAVRPAS